MFSIWTSLDFCCQVNTSSPPKIQNLILNISKTSLSCMDHERIYSLPENKRLDWLKLKGFADKKIKSVSFEKSSFCKGRCKQEKELFHL